MRTSLGPTQFRRGLLTIEFKRDVPEEMKARKIAIGGASSQVQPTGQEGTTANQNPSGKIAA